MKKYKSIKIDFVNERIANYYPSSEKPDMETIFPWFPITDELFDKYDNYQLGVSVTVKDEHTECKPILKPMQPTTEQVERYKKKRYVEEIRKSYTVDDEIALIKDCLNAILNKGEVSSEYFEMEVDRGIAKNTVQQEIDGELLKD